MSYGYTPIYPTTYANPYGNPYNQQSMMQQPVQKPPMQQMQANYICRPVASEEEARAVPTDFTGATIVMVDTAHGSIYTKSLNPMDGSAMFSTYRYTEPAPPAQEQPKVFAPMEELEKLRQEVANLRAAVQTKRPAAKGGSAE